MKISGGLFKDLLPPLMWSCLRRLKLLLSGGHPIYEPRVFMTHEEIPPVVENVWASGNWIESQYIFTALQKHGAGAELNVYQPLNVNASSLLLASGISLHLTEVKGPVMDHLKDTPFLHENEVLKKTVEILDIGGGLSGGFYPEMQKHLSAMGLGLKYAIVDGRMNCEFGEKFFHSHKNIKFYDFDTGGLEMAAHSLGSIDVCNLSSTLQYILDWRSAIASIISLRPRTIAISRTPFSDSAETEAYGIQHVSTHKGYCGRAKVVMIPRVMLIQEMQRHGYDCWAEHGTTGDASWYWQAGCQRQAYFPQANRSFIFVSRNL